MHSWQKLEYKIICRIYSDKKLYKLILYILYCKRFNIAQFIAKDLILHNDTWYITVLYLIHIYMKLLYNMCIIYYFYIITVIVWKICNRHIMFSTGIICLLSFDFFLCVCDRIWCRERRNGSGNMSYCLHLWLLNAQVQHLMLLLSVKFR